MKQNATATTATTMQQAVPALTAIKGFKDDAAQLNHYIQGAWLVAYTALWNGVVFSAAEKEQSLQLVKRWLLQQPDIEKGYKQMVQRILLTRQYLYYHTQKYLPVPTLWLSEANANGFAGTEAWYQSLEQKRSAMPLYRIELKGFAEAVLEMQEEPTGKNFHYWRGYFAERYCQHLLNLFLGVVGNGIMVSGER